MSFLSGEGEGEGGGRYFRGPNTSINNVGLPDYRMGESADVEEIEFFSDSGVRKAKLSA